MKEQKDYTRDIAEIRSMMERSSRFLSLSGWAGIMAGVYALIGVFVAYGVWGFNPGNDAVSTSHPSFPKILILAVIILALAIGTVVFLSGKNAGKQGEKAWNGTSKRMFVNMAIPLLAGGILILIFIARDMLEYMAPMSLLFYGLALFNAGKFTFEEFRSMGLVQICLGLLGMWFTEFGFLLWALGFGVVNIVYGAYMHYSYKK